MTSEYYFKQWKKTLQDLERTICIDLDYQVLRNSSAVYRNSGNHLNPHNCFTNHVISLELQSSAAQDSVDTMAEHCAPFRVIDIKA